jgi:hypothetical protein
MVGDGTRIVSASVACLHDAYALLRLEGERTVDARILRLYYDVLQIAVANGDQAKAKVIPPRLDSRINTCIKRLHRRASIRQEG